MSSDRIQTLVTIAVLGFIGVRLASGLRHSRSREGRLVVSTVARGIRFRHVWPAPFVITLVIVVATLLVQIPVLSWGWWTALGGLGNPVTGGTSETAGTVWEWAIPLAFFLLLFPALPLFAFAEERIFREGAEGWSNRRRVTRQIQFGLVHAIIGIPIGVALALSVGGGYFTLVYLRAYRRTGSQQEATFDSARAHTVYNALILSLVLLLAVLTAVDWFTLPTGRVVLSR